MINKIAGIADNGSARGLAPLNYTQKFARRARFGITADSAPPAPPPTPQQQQHRRRRLLEPLPYTFARTFRRWRSSNRAAAPAIYRCPWRRFIGDIRSFFRPQTRRIIHLDRETRPLSLLSPSFPYLPSSLSPSPTRMTISPGHILLACFLAR